ncbi:TPA: hypothetical protein ACN3ZO_003752, partial [Vibrio cholerae]
FRNDGIAHNETFANSFCSDAFGISILPVNALLRCEQRNTEASANHLRHKTQRIAKMPSVANHS